MGKLQHVVFEVRGMLKRGVIHQLKPYMVERI